MKRVILVLVGLSLSACGVGGATSASAASIGPSGGSVTSEDGRAVLTVPPGALPAETMIRVRAVANPSGETLLTPGAWEFEPDGLTFLTPAELRVQLDSVPDEGAMVMKWLGEGTWRVAPTRMDGTTAVAQVPGFSTYGVAPCGHSNGRLSCFPHVSLTAEYLPTRAIELRWERTMGAAPTVEVQRAIKQGPGALDVNALVDADFSQLAVIPWTSSSMTDQQIGPGAGIYWYRARVASGPNYVGPWSEPVRQTVFGHGTQPPIGQPLVPFDASWSGRTFQPLGTPYEAAGTSLAPASMVVHPSLGVVVALVETTSARSLLFVRRFDGTAWASLGGGALNASMGGQAMAPSLVRGPAGDLVLAWTEREGAFTRAHVKRWNGSSWNSLGTSVGVAVMVQVALMPSGEPVVAFESGETIQVRRFDGSNWVPLGERSGPVSSPVGIPRLVVAPGGTLYLAWVEGNATQQRVKVAASPDFEVMGGGPVFTVDPSDWQLTGFELSLTDQGHPRVVIASRYTQNRLVTRTWDGSAFVAADDLVASGSRYPVGGTSAFGVPVIAAVEDYRTVVVRFFDGTSWLRLGAPLARGDQYSGVAVAVEPTGQLTLALVMRSSSGAARLVLERLSP
jgi:hypothetical protein